MADTHALPNFVDAVGYKPSHGVTMFEFKSRRGKLTDSQQDLLDRGWPVAVIRSADEAIRFTTTDDDQGSRQLPKCPTKRTRSRSRL
jgi:hypothetical protein